MKAYTVYLDEKDIDVLQELARRMRLPPRVLARSLLLRMLEKEQINAAPESDRKEGAA